MQDSFRSSWWLPSWSSRLALAVILLLPCIAQSRNSGEPQIALILGSSGKSKAILLASKHGHLVQNLTTAIYPQESTAPDFVAAATFYYQSTCLLISAGTWIYKPDSDDGDKLPVDAAGGKWTQTLEAPTKPQDPVDCPHSTFAEQALRYTPASTLPKGTTVARFVWSASNATASSQINLTVNIIIR